MVYSKGGFFTFSDYCKDNDPDMAQSHVEQRAVCIFPLRPFFVPAFMPFFMPQFVPLQFDEARDENKRVTAAAVAKAVKAQQERWDELVQENERLKAAKVDPRQPILNETQMKWLQQQSAVLSAEKQRDQMKKERDMFAAKANRLGVENLGLKKKVEELKKASVFRATIRDNSRAMIRATNFSGKFQKLKDNGIDDEDDDDDKPDAGGEKAFSQQEVEAIIEESSSGRSVVEFVDQVSDRVVEKIMPVFNFPTSRHNSCHHSCHNSCQYDFS